MWSQLLPTAADFMCVIVDGFAKPLFIIIVLALVAARFRYELCYSYRYTLCHSSASTPAR